MLGLGIGVGKPGSWEATDGRNGREAVRREATGEARGGDC